MTVFTKGASENVVDDCIKVIEKDGKEIEFDTNSREQMKKTIISQMA